MEGGKQIAMLFIACGGYSVVRGRNGDMEDEDDAFPDVLFLSFYPVFWVFG